MIDFLCLVVGHFEWPIMQVLPLSLSSESDQRVYVEVYALPHGASGVSATTRWPTPAGRPRWPLRCTWIQVGPVVGERRGGVDDRTRLARPGQSVYARLRFVLDHCCHRSPPPRASSEHVLRLHG